MLYEQPTEEDVIVSLSSAGYRHEDVNVAPLSALAQSFHETNGGQQPYLWNQGVASPETIRLDLEWDNEPIMWSSVEDILNIRACPGRAASGHGAFTVRDGRRENGSCPDPKPNTTIEHIARETEYGVGSFYAACMDVVREYLEPVAGFIDKPYEREFYLHDDHGEPVLGLEFLRDIPLDPIEFSRGFYFGANWDGPIRKEVDRKYGFRMGWGESHPVSVDKLQEYGIWLNALSGRSFELHPLLDMLSHENRIALFKEIGVFRDELPTLDMLTLGDYTIKGVPVGNRGGERVINAYVREELGKGFSDDFGLCLSAFLPPMRDSFLDGRQNGAFSRMMGAFFADFTDTIEKTLPGVVPGGLDHAVGEALNGWFEEMYSKGRFRRVHNLRDLPPDQRQLVPDNVLRDFTAAGANTKKVVHSSARYFLMEHRDAPGMPPTCTLRELIFFIQSYQDERLRVISRVDGEREPSDLLVGFHRAPWTGGSYPVREQARDRIELVRRPEDRERNLTEFFAS